MLDKVLEVLNDYYIREFDSDAVLSKLPQFVQLIFGGSGIVPACIVAIVLNIVLPEEGTE